MTAVTRAALAVGALLALATGCATAEPTVAAPQGPTPGQARYLELVRTAGVQGEDSKLLEAAQAVCTAGLPSADENTLRWADETASDLLMYGFVGSTQDGQTVALSAEPACR